MIEERSKEILSNFNLTFQKLEAKSIKLNKSNELLELIISEYSDFDFLISEINKDSLENLFYRGVSNKEFDLLCGLTVNKLENYEIDLIHSLYLMAPDKFSACKNDFEMIALMQHYGLPTRFLDFTRNPMVALWFACQPQNTGVDTDGAVYCAIEKQSLPKHMIDLICKIALKDVRHSFEGVEKILTQEELNDYILFIYGCPYRMNFVAPPSIDLREINQQSVFLTAINELYLTDIKYDYGKKELITDENYFRIIQDFDSQNECIQKGKLQCYGQEDTEYLIKIIIPQMRKKDILKELECRGITEDFIYPTLENAAKRIKKQAIDSKNSFDKKQKEFEEWISKNSHL